MTKKKKHYLVCPNDSSHQISEWDGRYDAFACYTCDIWTERNCSCSASDCEFVARGRPERPSMVSRYVSWGHRDCTCGHIGDRHFTPGSACELCDCEEYLDVDTSYHTGHEFVKNKVSKQLDE